jgi:hypothetical protein
MSLTPAETVRKKTINSPQIMSVVNDIIESINNGILATCIQTNKYDHPMPMDLFIPGLAKANAQRIIYYHVARLIQKAGYNLELTMKKNSVIYNISWVTDMNDTDINKIDKYLARLRRNPSAPPKKPPTKNIPKKVDLELDDFYQDV